MDTTERLATDPVCGRDVIPSDESCQARYRGQTYYFCCVNCQLDFQEDPEEYTHSHA